MNKLFSVKVFTGLHSISHLTETVNAKSKPEAIQLAKKKEKKSLFNSGFIPPYTVAIDAIVIGGD